MAPIKIPDDLAKALLSAAEYHEARETGSYYATFTPEEHLEHFGKIDIEYRASSCAKKIEEIIRSKAPVDGWPIDSAICFGFCSFSSAYWGKRSDGFFRQLANFLHVIEIVQEGKEKPLIKYAQDPIFNDVDKAFLERLGIKVVEDPEGLSLINKSTFMYCPFLSRDIPVLQQDEHPVLYMGNTCENTIWMLAGKLQNAFEQRSIYFRKLIPEARAQLPNGFVGSKENFGKLKETWAPTADDDPKAPLQIYNKYADEYKKCSKELSAVIRFRNSRELFKGERCLGEGEDAKCDYATCLNIAIDRGLWKTPVEKKPEDEREYPFIEWPLHRLSLDDA
ncbi:hypothetical protein B0T14DRAFT_198071 [Immersiella caudata]|uniref:SRR1-like domain-containing protein n=1 Tax=Immersiella caudata TaxID=314043 RepID=A0AA39WP11_9PEZI|nr:hypothetical protein B0T14DRAFT_198071 [Immersiella caudata]